jgi:excisionase family DNA binding protein
MTPALTVRDVAKRYGIGQSQVYKMVAERRIPHVRLSDRVIRFREEDLDQWERDRTIHTSPCTEGSSPSPISTSTANAVAARQAKLSVI